MHYGDQEPVALDNMNDEAADARLEQVLEAINNEDKDALKSMFSQTALEEAEDFV